jgi:hypothetical protein
MSRYAVQQWARLEAAEARLLGASFIDSGAHVVAVRHYRHLFQTAIADLRIELGLSAVVNPVELTD